MTKKKEAAAADFIPEGRAKNTATVESTKALALVSPFKQEIESLTIEDVEGLQRADLLLGKVRLARKGWAAVWTRIQTRTVKPIRDGLEELYTLNRDVDGPYEALEKSLKGKMDTFRLEEARIQRQRAQEAEQERQRLATEIESKRIAAEAARTPQMRGKLAAAAERLQESLETVAVEGEAPIATINSSTRTVEKVRVPDLMDLIKAIARGDVPLTVPSSIGPTPFLDINLRVLNAWFVVDPETVRELAPVIEVYDDIRTVGR